MKFGVYPVRRSGWPAPADAQGALPWGWCPACGMEIWDREEALCDKCRKGLKQEVAYERSKALPGVLGDGLPGQGMSPMAGGFFGAVGPGEPVRLGAKGCGGTAGGISL